MRASDVPDRLRAIADGGRADLQGDPGRYQQPDQVRHELHELARVLEAETGSELIGRGYGRAFASARPGLERIVQQLEQVRRTGRLPAIVPELEPGVREPDVDLTVRPAGPPQVQRYLAAARSQLHEVDDLAAAFCEGRLLEGQTPSTGDLAQRVTLLGRGLDDLIDGVAHLARWAEQAQPVLEQRGLFDSTEPAEVPS